MHNKARQIIAQGHKKLRFSVFADVDSYFLLHVVSSSPRASDGHQDYSGEPVYNAVDNQNVANIVQHY